MAEDPLPIEAAAPPVTTAPLALPAPVPLPVPISSSEPAPVKRRPGRPRGIPGTSRDRIEDLINKRGPKKGRYSPLVKRAITAIVAGSKKKIVADQLGITTYKLTKIIADNPELMERAKLERIGLWADVGKTALVQVKLKMKKASALQAATIAGIAEDKMMKLSGMGEKENAPPPSKETATLSMSPEVVAKVVKILAGTQVFKKKEPEPIDVTPKENQT